jgi:hypothetical protein
MKHIITGICMILLLMVLTACSSDDKREPINYPIEQNITGRWYLAGFDSGSGYVEYNWLCEQQKDYLEFLDDGSSIEQNFNGDCEVAYTMNTTWSVNGVYLSLDNVEDEAEKNYKIIVLNDNNLMLEHGTQSALGAKPTTLYYSK